MNLTADLIDREALIVSSVFLPYVIDNQLDFIALTELYEIKGDN
jgi:hypothetical protein